MISNLLSMLNVLKMISARAMEDSALAENDGIVMELKKRKIKLATEAAATLQEIA